MNERDQGALIRTNKPTQTTNIVEATVILSLVYLLLVLVLVARPLLSPVRWVVLLVAFEPCCSYSKLETDKKKQIRKLSYKWNTVNIWSLSAILLIFFKSHFSILYLLLHPTPCSSSLLTLTFQKLFVLQKVHQLTSSLPNSVSFIFTSF